MARIWRPSLPSDGRRWTHKQRPQTPVFSRHRQKDVWTTTRGEKPTGSRCSVSDCDVDLNAVLTRSTEFKQPAAQCGPLLCRWRGMLFTGPVYIARGVQLRLTVPLPGQVHSQAGALGATAPSARYGLLYSVLFPDILNSYFSQTFRTAICSSINTTLTRQLYRSP